MKTMLSVLVIAAVALVACKRSEDASLFASPPPKVSPPAVSSNAAATPDATMAGPDVSQPVASPQAPVLALAYRLGLVVPADQVRALMESHQEACERAGTDQCQVMAAQASADGDDRASAELTLRATPAWMRMFRTRAEADAKGLGGRIEEAATEGDDLSGSIVDTEAAQRARAAERQRLTELLRRRTQNLDQTLQVEQELTRVQGDMDQAASELAAMQNRIVMQTVTVHYESAAIASPNGPTAPLQVAARSFWGNVYGMLAVLLTLASFVLPLGLVGAPLAWWLSRRRRGKASPAAAG